MNHRVLLLSALALLAPIAACSDDKLLDVVSPTQVADDNFWSKESDAVLFLAGTYSTLPDWNLVISLDGLTDNGTVNRQFDARYVFADGSFDPQSAYSRDRWNNFYNGVARANILLANIDRIPATQIDAARKARYVAEARFLRGVSLLWLTSLFGDVPMPLKPLTDAEARELTNTPAAAIYTQILADLDAAAAALPTTYPAADYGRATRGAALAYKARAGLYAGRFAEAAAAAKAVMDLNVYSLVPNYASLFTYAGEASAEVIFVRKYAKTTVAQGQNNNIFGEHGPPTNSGISSVVPIRNLVDFYQSIDGRPTSTSPLFNPNPDSIYVRRDPRLAATILYPGAPWDGGVFDSRPTSTKAERLNLQLDNVSVTGYNVRKYIAIEDKADRGNGGLDMILMRYADVLLMYAEAKFEAGQNDATALAALNQVRTRAGMPALTALTQADIRYERRAELAFEGLRMFDLRRWKTAAAVMPVPQITGISYNSGGNVVTATVPASARSFAARAYLWPIPQTELDLNKNLKQNPGF
jgi:hypothetical protein